MKRFFSSQDFSRHEKKSKLTKSNSLSGVKMEGKDYLDIMPGSPPVFEGLVKLKEKKVEPKIEPKTEPKSGPEVTPKNVKTVKKIEGTPIDSPHKIYLRTEKKKKEKPKVDKVKYKVKLK